MQELEKILEEIDETIDRYGKNQYIDEKVTDLCYGMNLAKQIIRKHMNDGWIPVEKDLPKNGSEVLVVLESTYGTGYSTYSIARYLYFENYGESHWCDNQYGYLEWDKYSDGHGGSSKYKVIAWQSIAPYCPERSDNHDE